MFPLLLYSEIHFRFGGISPSRLFKKEPEIIFDLPARCAPEAPLYLTLLLHDIHRFPLTDLSLDIELSQEENSKKIHLTNLLPYLVTHPHNKICQAFSIPLDIAVFTRDRSLTVTPKATYTCNGKRKSCISDNLPGNQKLPLRTFLAKQLFPEANKAHYFDMHCHSLHTRDHVEFGAPIQIIAQSTQSFGLDGALIIDHSYDLSCTMEEYLMRDDVALSNWHAQQATPVDNHEVLLLRGEELSIRKALGGVVHLGVWGHRTFIPGTGDGARKGYNASREPRLPEAVQLLKEEGGVCFAAHPGEKTHPLHKLFLRRDSWEKDDFTTPIDGFQAVNRDFGVSWSRAKRVWTSLLLEGKKIPLLAGNDAHGDFNRYRALTIPFWKLSEDLTRYFGHMRTGFYTTSPALTEQLITEALREGRTFITSGPFVDLVSGSESMVGKGSNAPLSINIVSSLEYGSLESVVLSVGTIGCKKEKLFSLSLPKDVSTFSEELPPEWYINASYIRAEVRTHVGLNGLQHHAATSPAYISSTSE